ncbi:MAG: FeS-binding protein [Anaerolineae bacterium]|nr:MAG: FeS-binding protein [Anaerolineae bacterium]
MSFLYGGPMSTHQLVRLTYPSNLLRVPVINQLIKEFDITVNILRAQIDAQNGWIDIELSGNMHIVEEAIQWLQNQGVKVEFIKE